MKSDRSYVLLAIMIILLAGFFYLPKLTGYQAFGPSAPTTSGTQIAPSSITAPSVTAQKIVLTTGNCPTGYSLAGSTTLSYSTTGTTSAAYAWSANKANPSSSQDYTAIITGPTTTGRVNYCILSGSNILQITSGYKTCTTPYDANPATSNRGAIGINIVAQSFSQAINPPGTGAIFTACTTQPRTYGQDCSAHNQCASNSCDFSVGKCNVYEKQVLMLDATDDNQLASGPYPIRSPDFAKQCPSGYEAIGIVANLEITNNNIKNWYYTLICARGTSSTYTTTTTQPIGPSGPALQTTTTQQPAPIAPVPTSLIVTYNDCVSAKESCINLNGEIHSGPGRCDGLPEGYSTSGISIDSGWIGMCASDSMLITTYDDCTNYRARCPTGYASVGNIHTGPGLCDGYSEGVDYNKLSVDSGWMSLCTRNSESVTIIDKDDCQLTIPESCPTGYTRIGNIHTGPGRCDGLPEGYSTSGISIDSGWIGMCKKTTTTPGAPGPQPTGLFETANCNQVSGWACDPSNPSAQLIVLFKDSTGTPVFKALANIAREAAVAQQCGGNANHGFSWNVPNFLKTGTQQSLSAYGVTSTGSQFQLNGNPKSITCSLTPGCSDGIRNQDESGIDCGGTICSTRCGSGIGCNINNDCISGSCINNVCSTTTTAVQPLGETLPLAPTRVGTRADAPFQSHCYNGIKDADETDVDCGGSGCGGCGFNKTCSATIGYGCVSGLTCSNNICKKISGSICSLSSECASGLSCVSGRCGTVTPSAPAPSAPSAPTISTGGGGGGGGSRAARGAAFICSNNRLDFGEECDDGNILNDDGCTADCKIEYCGDGAIQYGVKEECDPPDDITCALGCTLIAEKPSIPIPKPAVQEPVYQPPIIPVYEPERKGKLGSVAKVGGIIIAIAALGTLLTWIIRKKFRRQQQPYVLPVRYSRGSR